MKLVIWNVRGCNKPFKQKELRLFLQKNKLDVFVMLETRLKNEKFQQIVRRMSRNWEFVINHSHHENGRVCIGWNPGVITLKVMDMHAQGIWCELGNLLTGKSFHLVAVYAFNTREKRVDMWKFISHVSRVCNGPLFIGGDFNTVLCADERFQGNPVTEHDTKDFRDCMLDNDLTQVRRVGHDFTWCNNQSGNDRIYSLLDRCIANADWMMEYGGVVSEIMDRGISDHCPQMICIDEDSRLSHSPFRFINVIAQHEDFMPIVKRIWTNHYCDNKLLNICYKLKALKKPLKQLNTVHFKKIAERLEGLRTNLTETQNLLMNDKLNPDLVRTKQRILADIEKWSAIEENVWQQKSRVDWITLGDSNTKFFHSFAKMRQHIKAIKLLVTVGGDRCITQSAIKNEIRAFYLSLMGSAAPRLPMIDKEVMRRGPTIQRDQQMALCAEFTNKEIKAALFSMDSMKACDIPNQSETILVQKRSLC